MGQEQAKRKGSNVYWKSLHSILVFKVFVEDRPDCRYGDRLQRRIWRRRISHRCPLLSNPDRRFLPGYARELFSTFWFHVLLHCFCSVLISFVEKLLYSVNKMTSGARSITSARESQMEVDDEPIIIPPVNTSDLLFRSQRTLIGCLFHTERRSMNAILAFLSRSHIWNVEGRVRCIDLGNGYDFDNEEDLLRVLNKRHCHFNQWHIAL